MSNDAHLCPSCSAPLHRRGDMAYCPSCLINQVTLHEIDSPRPTAQAPTPEELGSQFPGYEIQSLLGVGGMGMVYRARQKNLDREVALKIIPESPHHPEFSERFEREAQTLAKLNHPDFVQVYDHGRVPGWFYLAMELVEGADLGTLLEQEGPLEPAQAHRQIGRLLESLALAHEQGIIHRDLKPANLLVTEDSLKVADFGLAKLTGTAAPAYSLTGDQTAIGTPYYIAPEQREGAADVDQRADLFSVGVILYQTITGKLPAGNYEEPSRLAPVGSAFDRFMAKALAPSASERFQSALEMKHALDRCLRTPSRLLWLSIGAALALISVWLIQRPGPEPPAPEPPGQLSHDSQVNTISAPDGSPEYFGTFTEATKDWLAVSAPDAGYFIGKPKQPGAVYLYRLHEGEPVLHQTLQAPRPKNRDVFGWTLAFSKNGNELAVYANAGRKNKHARFHFHFYRLNEQNQWQHRQTVEFLSTIKGTWIAPRLTFGHDEFLISSPGASQENALFSYTRGTDGQWQLHSRPQLATALNSDAKLGFQARYHDDQLFVTAMGYQAKLALWAGALLIFEKDTEGSWRETQRLTQPEAPALAFFSFDLTFTPEGHLLVGAPLSKAQDVASAGNISEFHRVEANGQWEFLHRIEPHHPGELQRGFGHQVLALSNRLLITSLLGSVDKVDPGFGQSRAHLYHRTDDGWQRQRTLDAEGVGDTWLARGCVLGNRFVIPNPGKKLLYLLDPVR